MKNLQQVEREICEKRILVTGGTGFIGGRLIERLSTAQEVQIRVLVRNLSRACRIARFPLELVPGDVTDADAVARAAQDCHIIFHCAYGNSGSRENQRAINIQGTQNVLDAAVTNRVERLVHLSTILVYGETPDGDVDELAPRRRLGHVYADSKLEAEELVMRYAQRREIPATVLQPAEVYGPYGTVWTQDVLRSLKTTRQILIDDGLGLGSPVYVDDLVSAMLLAALKKEALGEVFLIAAEPPITWKEFYAAFESMLGFSATVNMSAQEALAYYKTTVTQRKPVSIVREIFRLLCYERECRDRLLRTREAEVLRRFARRFVSADTRQSLRNSMFLRGGVRLPAASTKNNEEKPLKPLDPLSIRLNQTKTVFRIDKAKKMLGYEPQFTFEAGMRLTQHWAQWSNLLEG